MLSINFDCSGLINPLKQEELTVWSMAIHRWTFLPEFLISSNKVEKRKMSPSKNRSILTENWDAKPSAKRNYLLYFILIPSLILIQSVLFCLIILELVIAFRSCFESLLILSKIGTRPRYEYTSVLTPIEIIK